MSDELAARLDTLEPKLAKRLSATGIGHPKVVVRCSWKGKPAVIALTDHHDGRLLDGLAYLVAFVSSGLTGTTVVTQARVSSLEMVSPSKGVLRVGTELFNRFNIEFESTTDGPQLAGIITRLGERELRALPSLLPLQVGEHERAIRSCVYLGGAYLPLASGSRVDLVFRESALQVFASPAMDGGEPAVELPFSAMFQLEVAGPGKVTTGGGFLGGGSGLLGAAEGIAIAGLLNAFTTKTSITTVLAVRDESHEGFFVNAYVTPEDLRRQLSPVFVRVRQHQGALSGAAETVAISDDLVTKLERLGALRSSGLLTDEEFGAAKAALIADR